MKPDKFHHFLEEINYVIDRDAVLTKELLYYNKQYIEQLPIRTIDFSDPADKRRHDEMVTLVERMLDLHKKLPAAHTDQEKTALQRQIADTDRRIDRLVYDLYGLTEDEIKIVEGTA